MTATKMKIKKGDQVVILTGKDKGKKGEVLRTIPAEQRIVVAGVNVVTRHVKPSAINPEGGLKKQERAIHVSNAALLDPKDNKAVRVGYATDKDGSKVRVARRSSARIDEPAFKKAKG